MTQICDKCKQPIKDGQMFRHFNGVGDVHYICPSDGQLSLTDSDELPIDHVPEAYPD